MLTHTVVSEGSRAINPISGKVYFCRFLGHNTKWLSLAGESHTKSHTMSVGYRVHGMPQGSMMSHNNKAIPEPCTVDFYLSGLQREQLGHGREECIREICNQVATQITEDDEHSTSFNYFTYRFWILMRPSKEPFCNVSGSLLDKLLHVIMNMVQQVMCQ